MTSSRDCLQAALDHRTPDRIPVDLGSTTVTGVHVRMVELLRRELGLPWQPVKVIEPYQMLGEVDDALAGALGVDVVGLMPRKTMFGFENTGWRERRLPWGQEVLVPAGFVTTEGPEGDLLIYPEGDASARPSARMPRTGFFFDTIVRQDPIDEARLDPADNLEEFAPLAEEDLAYWRREIARVRAGARALVVNVGGTALGDIALVPAPWMKNPRGIRDVAEWYISTAVRFDYVYEVFRRQCEIGLKNLAKIYDAVGDRVAAVLVTGTNFGTQNGPFISPDAYRRLFQPFHRRVNDWIHRHTPWKSLIHSCGSVIALLPYMVESGFDILNPVQCSAAGMDPQTLKDRFGDRLSFWGGGVDTQKTLPFGTPDQVRREVQERIAIFGRGGGFVFNTVHNVQARTPVENLLALYDAVRANRGK